MFICITVWSWDSSVDPLCHYWISWNVGDFAAHTLKCPSWGKLCAGNAQVVSKLTACKQRGTRAEKLKHGR